MKKMKPMLLAVMVCMLALLGIPAAAKAAAAPVCPKKQTIRIIRNRDRETGKKYKEAYGGIYIKNLAKNAKIVNIKSSNPKFDGEKFPGIDAISVAHDIETNIKSGERTTISFTVKQNGKSYKLSCEVICVPFGNQFKYFQIGSKGYAALFNGYQDAFKKIAQTGKEKLIIKTTDAYKLDHIYLYYKNRTRPVQVKSGDVISLKNLKEIMVDYHVAKDALYYKEPGKGFMGKAEPFHYSAILHLDNAPWVPSSSLAM